MKLPRLAAIAALGLLTIAAGCGDKGPDRKKPVYRADKVASNTPAETGAADSTYGPDGGSINLSAAATIKGKIKFPGQAPAPVAMDLGKDKFCLDNHKVFKEDLLVSADGGLKDMFVYIEKGLDGKGYPKPAKTARVIQDGCRYIPHVFPVRAGVDFEVENKDNTNHNYHFIGRKNDEINQSQNGPKVDTVRLNKPEIGAQMKCDVHPWMLVNVHVVDHDCYAVSDENGNFELKGLPPGKYRLSFKHERSAIKLDSMDIMVTANEVKDIGTLTTK